MYHEKQMKATKYSIFFPSSSLPKNCKKYKEKRDVGQNCNFIKIIRFLHNLKALNERISEWAHF